MKTYEEFFRDFSGTFCSEYLPHNWEDIFETEHDLCEWLEEHRCENCEYWDGSTMFEFIDGLASEAAHASRMAFREGRELERSINDARNV